MKGIRKKLEWRKVRTQYVGGDTYVAIDFPELQIIGRPTDTKQQLYLVLNHGQIMARGYSLKEMQRFCEQSLNLCLF